MTGEVLLVHLDAIEHSLVVLVLLLVARLVLRSELRAAVCSAILWTMAQGLLNNAPLAGWLLIGLALSLGIAVLVRFGLVAYIAAVFAFDVLRLPVTTDTTAFYFGNGLVAMTLVAVIALYGLNTSLGRRSLFGNAAKAR